MNKAKRSVQWWCGSFISVLAACLLAGSQSSRGQTAATTTNTPSSTNPPAAAQAAIHINAGDTTSHTNSSGEVWLADQGFADGDMVDRGSDMKIANTKDPAIYRTERYGMSSFSYKLPNGKYTVKLHFAETYDGITAAGQRVFSFKVQDREFKDFDVWVKAGGSQRAYIETVSVDGKDGKPGITL